MWARIAKSYPTIFFYAYTKADKDIVLDSVNGNIRFTLSGGLEFDRDRLLDFSPLKSLENFALISSYIDINVYDDEDKIIGKKTTFNFGNAKFLKNVIRTYPNNNLVLNADKPFIVMNEEGEAYPIVADYVIKRVKSTVETDDNDEVKGGTTIEQLPNTDEFSASDRARELNKIDKEIGKPTQYIAKKKKGGILTEDDKFVAEGYAKSYDDYDVWLCPATNPSLRSKHLVTCGEDCSYCTKKTKGQKKVCFWLH